GRPPAERSSHPSPQPRAWYSPCVNRALAVLAAVALLATSRVAMAAKPAPSPAPASLVSMRRQMRDLVDRVSPTVVQIAAVAVAPVGGGRTATGNGFVGVERRGGSGVIVSKDGYIVT